MGRFFYWLPRILSVIFIIAISAFALDSFSSGYIWWQAILAFIIHLIPSFILIGILLIAWKKPMIGGLLLVFISLVFIALSIIKGIISFLILSGPLFLIGVLFLIEEKIINSK